MHRFSIIRLILPFVLVAHISNVNGESIDINNVHFPKSTKVLGTCHCELPQWTESYGLFQIPPKFKFWPNVDYCEEAWPVECQNHCISTMLANEGVRNFLAGQFLTFGSRTEDLTNFAIRMAPFLTKGVKSTRVSPSVPLNEGPSEPFDWLFGSEKSNRPNGTPPELVTMNWKCISKDPRDNEDEFQGEDRLDVRDLDSAYFFEAMGLEHNEREKDQIKHQMHGFIGETRNPLLGVIVAAPLAYLATRFNSLVQNIRTIEATARSTEVLQFPTKAAAISETATQGKMAASMATALDPDPDPIFRRWRSPLAVSCNKIAQYIPSGTRCDANTLRMEMEGDYERAWAFVGNADILTTLDRYVDFVSENQNHPTLQRIVAQINLGDALAQWVKSENLGSFWSTTFGRGKRAKRAMDAAKCLVSSDYATCPIELWTATDLNPYNPNSAIRVPITFDGFREEML